MDGNVAHPPAGSREHQLSLRALFYLMTVGCIIFALVAYSDAAWMPAITIFAALTAFAAAFFLWRAEHAIIGCCFLCLLYWIPHRYPRPNHRGYCRNNLKQISLALHSYRDFYGEFPPAVVRAADGKPMHSWRVLLLPFLELQPVYDQYDFNEPWDGPNNSQLARLPGGLQFWRCPAETQAVPGCFETSYVAVVGSRTAWPGSSSLDPNSVTDGVEETLWVVEVKNSGIHWMEPRDLDIRTMPLKINSNAGSGLGSNHAKGCNAACCDGSVHYLPDDMPAATLRALLTRDGGEDPTRVLHW